MVQLGRMGEGDRKDIPLHFEATPLRSWVVVLGWPVGLVLVALGLCAVVWGHGSVLEIVGVVAAMKGGLILTLLIRCRRFEVVATARWLEVGAGPLRRKAPAGILGVAAVRDATSWRWFFADREVVVELAAGGQALVIPTAEPAETLAVLSEISGSG